MTYPNKLSNYWTYHDFGFKSVMYYEIKYLGIHVHNTNISVSGWLQEENIIVSCFCFDWNIVFVFFIVIC
jgi:hypothetical protein